MGGSGSRRWVRRSCRTGGGGGVVVRRTFAAPSGASTARRVTEGYAHVDKQRRVLSDFRCSSGSTDHLYSEIGEFKHKTSNSCSTSYLPCTQRNPTEISHMQPPLMAELKDAASGVLVHSQKTSLSWPRENKSSNNKGSYHACSTVSGLSIQPKYCLNGPRKNRPTANSCTDMSDFSSQLARSAERSTSLKMGYHSNCSLSEKMNLLCQPRNGGNHQNQNRISALKQRYKIVNSSGAINLLSKEKIHDQLDSSLGRHSQALLNNALARQNQLCCSELMNHKAHEQLWSSAHSENEKIICFSSSVSSSSENENENENEKIICFDDLHVS